KLLTIHTPHIYLTDSRHRPPAISAALPTLARTFLVVSVLRHGTLCFRGSLRNDSRRLIQRSGEIFPERRLQHALSPHRAGVHWFRERCHWRHCRYIARWVLFQIGEYPALRLR